jgi:V/A-type H+-transporting ATPase subunit I
MITTKLTEVTIIGYKKEKSHIVKTLQELGIIHITKANIKEEGFVQDKVRADLDIVSKQLLKLQFITEQSQQDYPYELTTLPDYEELQTETNEFLTTYFSKIKEQAAIKKDCQQKKEQKLAQLTILKNIPFTIQAALADYTHRLYFSEKSLFFPKKRKEIRFVLKKVKTPKGYFYLFTLAERDVDKLKEALQQTPLKKIDISFLEHKGKNEKEQELRQELETLETTRKKADWQLEKILAIERIKIPYLITSLENYREQFMLSTQFLTSKNFFIIKGYCEPEKLPLLKKELPYITLLSKNAGPEAPTKFKERKIGKHFQIITELFGTPAYGSVDPTPLIALFYPLFFGFMFADIGYGLLLLFFVALLRIFLGKEFHSAYVIFGLSGIVAIIFGLCFGSFFGNLIPVTPLIGDSFSIAFPLLIASLAIGLIHLNIGTALNMYQMKQHKKPMRDILMKATGFYILQLAVIAAILGFSYLALGFGGLLLVLLIKEKGAFGIMDLTGFVGNLFSYARLLALSLASGGLALVINIIANKALSFGKLGIVLWLLILLVGHSFNFILGVLGCTIHAARLHYVEFFSFFFEGEGTKFNPFTLKKTHGGTEKWQ